MSICVVQYYNRVEHSHLIWRTHNNLNKCMNNCTYINIHATETRSPYWEKVFRVRDIAESMRSKCEFVLYLDADAVLNVQATNIVTLFDRSPYIHMMWKWTTLYPQDDWVKRDDRWYCIHKAECKQWAGPMYEQGSFVREIIPAYKHAIRQVPLNIFSGMGMVREMSGKRHLCSAKSLICHIFDKSISKQDQYIKTSWAWRSMSRRVT